MKCVDEDEYETGIGVKPETLVGSFGDMRGRRKEIISVGSRKVIGKSDHAAPGAKSTKRFTLVFKFIHERNITWVLFGFFDGDITFGKSIVERETRN